MAHPKPALVQNMNQWTLNPTYTQPEQIVPQLSPTQKPQRFWYVILTPTNETSLEDVQFFQVCQLVTDTFESIPEDKKVPSALFEMIKRKHQGSCPFGESLDFKNLRIFRGKDNTRDIAFVWPDFDFKAKEISFFIGGLSNETPVLEHPKLKDGNGDPKRSSCKKSCSLNTPLAAMKNSPRIFALNKPNRIG